MKIFIIAQRNVLITRDQIQTTNNLYYPTEQLGRLCSLQPIYYTNQPLILIGIYIYI